MALSTRIAGINGATVDNTYQTIVNITSTKGMLGAITLSNTNNQSNEYNVMQLHITIDGYGSPNLIFATADSNGILYERDAVLQRLTKMNCPFSSSLKIEMMSTDVSRLNYQCMVDYVVET